MCDGYWRRDDREWDRTRHIIAMIYNSNVDKASQKTPQQLYPLSFDGFLSKQEGKTPEEINKMFEEARSIKKLKLIPIDLKNIN